MGFAPLAARELRLFLRLRAMGTLLDSLSSHGLPELLDSGDVALDVTAAESSEPQAADNNSHRAVTEAEINYRARVIAKVRRQ